jgi:hypothetical protein
VVFAGHGLSWFLYVTSSCNHWQLRVRRGGDHYIDLELMFQISKSRTNSGSFEVTFTVPRNALKVSKQVAEGPSAVTVTAVPIEQDHADQ